MAQVVTPSPQSWRDPCSQVTAHVARLPQVTMQLSVQVMSHVATLSHEAVEPPPIVAVHRLALPQTNSLPVPVSAEQLVTEEQSTMQSSPQVTSQSGPAMQVN